MDYLTTLQGRVANLRRKILEEHAEQERVKRRVRRARCEAERLRSEAEDAKAEINAEREHLKELSLQAVAGRFRAEAYKKEVADRHLQIPALESEMQEAVEKADRVVSD